MCRGSCLVSCGPTGGARWASPVPKTRLTSRSADYLVDFSESIVECVDVGGKHLVEQIQLQGRTGGVIKRSGPTGALSGRASRLKVPSASETGGLPQSLCACNAKRSRTEHQHHSLHFGPCSIFIILVVLVAGTGRLEEGAHTIKGTFRPSCSPAHARPGIAKPPVHLLFHHTGREAPSAGTRSDPLITSRCEQTPSALLG